jgi:DNA-binding phage protein
MSERERSPLLNPGLERGRRCWTAQRQLAFLDGLARSRSVSSAAKAAGMSRESAYRLRNRRDGALFAALWDIALAPGPGPKSPGSSPSKGHTSGLSNGQLMRLLGTHYRRERGDFLAIGARPAKAHGT